TKDLSRLKYFLGIEIAQSRSCIIISQRKYASNILEETEMMGCRPIDTLMNPNVKLLPRQWDPLSKGIDDLLESLIISHQLPLRDYSLRINAMNISLDMQMVIGQDHPLTDIRIRMLCFSWSGNSEIRMSLMPMSCRGSSVISFPESTDCGRRIETK
uniref:Reverse transcriptase Ty1/copia-type domain-containing protein n=1 Tax=Solanum lycopersicum TaxID=4081 RepID=A0A3Q7GV86_SOLLC